MNKYMILFVTVHDSNPNESGPCSWPSFTALPYRGLTVATIRRRVIADATRQARECGQYEDNDTLWYDMVDADGIYVDRGTF